METQAKDKFFSRISITPQSIVMYNINDLCVKNEEKKIVSLNNLKLSKDIVDLSGKSRKKLIDSVNWFVAASEKKRLQSTKTSHQFEYSNNFVTLTLSAPQYHKDKELQEKLLQPMLNNFRQKYDVKSYIWRAECQKNGNLHWHIMTHKYIDHKALRNDWNRHQANLGYIDKFEAKHKHRDPNSTDVHALFDVTNVGGYISKYMAKSDTPLPNEKTNLYNARIKEGWKLQASKKVAPEQIKDIQVIKARLYGTSSNFPQIDNPSMQLTKDIWKECNSLIKAGAKVKEPNEYCKVIHLNNTLLTKVKPEIIQTTLDTVIDNIYSLVN